MVDITDFLPLRWQHGEERGKGLEHSQRSRYFLCPRTPSSAYRNLFSLIFWFFPHRFYPTSGVVMRHYFHSRILSSTRSLYCCAEEYKCTSMSNMIQYNSKDCPSMSQVLVQQRWTTCDEHLQPFPRGIHPERQAAYQQIRHRRYCYKKRTTDKASRRHPPRQSRSLDCWRRSIWVFATCAIKWIRMLRHFIRMIQSLISNGSNRSKAATLLLWIHATFLLLGSVRTTKLGTKFQGRITR